MDESAKVKRAWISVPKILCIILAATLAWVFYVYAALHIRVSLAYEYITEFEQMRTEAIETSDVGEAVGKLRHTIRFYPSGSTQFPGSKVDRIVETARSHAVRDIVAHLRKIAPKDLGDDSDGWLVEYR